MRRDSSVDTGFVLRAGPTRNIGSIFRRRKKFFRPPKRPDWLLGLSNVLLSLHEAYFPVVKRFRHEAYHTPSYSAEVKNK